MKKPIIVLLLSLPMLASAGPPLSLRSALDIAVKNNFEVQLATNAAEASRIANTAGASGALPSVSLVVRDRESNLDVNQRFSNGTVISRDGTGSNNLSGDVLVNYTLFNGLRIQATRKRLTALQEIGDQKLLLQLQNTMSSVITTYFDVVRQQGYLKALERSREFAAKKLDIIDQRQKVGLANNADLFQAQIDLNTSDQNLAEQSLLIRRAEVELAVQLGLPPDTMFVLTDSIMIDKSLTLDSVLNMIARNPELIAATGSVMVNDQLIREIRSQRLPSLKLEGGYTYSRTANQAGFSLLNQYNGPLVGATLQVPVFNGGAIRTQEKVATLGRSNAKLEEQLVRQRITARSITAFEAYRTAIGQLEHQEESFSLASRVLDIQLLRFSNSQATILDLRAAQSGFEQTAASLVNARYIAKIAETELRRLTASLN